MFAATQAFGSELRVHLIHYYASHPGRQIDAVRALGVERAVVSLNTRALIETGVLTVDEDSLVAEADKVGRRVWSQVEAATPVIVPRLPRS